MQEPLAGGLKAPGRKRNKYLILLKFQLNN
jgi:hypothetical protein